MRDICVDTGFLIGLYQPRHDFHARAQEYFHRFFAVGGNRMLVPWPIVYETFSTRTVRNAAAMTVLHSDWKRLQHHGQLRLLDDVRFRQRVIDDCFNELAEPPARRRNLSAVDRVLREILSDRSLRISAFITFNSRDFADVCKRFRRDLVSPA